jgi:O-antigen ligase
VNAVGLPRSLVVYTIVLPLALLVGFLLATPEAFKSIALVGLLIVALCIPVFLRWHQTLLILAWNANITLSFLPGKPNLWMIFAGIGLGIIVLNCILDKRSQFQHVPSVTWSLLFLLAVVFVTGKLTGGIAFRSLGASTYGGKKFVFIFAAIIGYFALSSQRVEPRRVSTLSSAFFLSGLTGVASNLIYFAGPAFYFLYLIFPVDYALGYAVDDLTIGSTSARIGRLPGASAAGMAGLFFLLLRYGIRGLLDVTKPWRFIMAIVLLGCSLLGGFRSVVLIVAVLVLVQFYFEGLFRSRLAIYVLLAGVAGIGLFLPVVKHMPLSVQRSISLLPVEVDTAARAQAEGSLEWRLEMWQILLKQIPQYFWVGKGYAIDPTDLYFAQESARRGLAKDYEGAIVAGDYHSGPLSILIPFGIFGLVAFLWFVFASIRLLYRNHVFSEDKLRMINTFLLAYFVCRTIFYFVGFGALHSDLQMFVGIVGLSIAINGGVRGPSREAEQLLPVGEPAVAV